MPADRAKLGCLISFFVYGAVFLFLAGMEIARGEDVVLSPMWLIGAPVGLLAWTAPRELPFPWRIVVQAGCLGLVAAALLALLFLIAAASITISV